MALGTCYSERFCLRVFRGMGLLSPASTEVDSREMAHGPLYES
jgi:hypothetical protein